MKRIASFSPRPRPARPALLEQAANPNPRLRPAPLRPTHRPARIRPSPLGRRTRRRIHPPPPRRLGITNAKAQHSVSRQAGPGLNSETRDCAKRPHFAPDLATTSLRTAPHQPIHKGRWRLEPPSWQMALTKSPSRKHRLTPILEFASPKPNRVWRGTTARDHRDEVRIGARFHSLRKNSPTPIR